MLSILLSQKILLSYFYENRFSLFPDLKSFLYIMICIFILNIFSMQDKKPEAQLQALILSQFSRSEKSCHNTQTKQPCSNIPIRHIHASRTT